MRVDATTVRLRNFVTLLTFFSFLAALISGIALYLRPEGSLARWMGWGLVGWDKKQWEAAHMTAVFLLAISALVHLGYNFKGLVSCLRGRIRLLFPSRARRLMAVEAMAAFVLVMAMLLLTVSKWGPLSVMIDLRDAIKEGKYFLAVRPPAADADRLTLTEFCRVARLHVPSALERARARGIMIDDVHMTVGKIAQENRISPENLFAALRGD